MSVAAFINTCVALLVATLVLVQPSALPLLGVVVVLLVLGYRVYISLARGHAQTHLLYRFVDRTSSARSSEEVIEIVLREAADLMHAEHAYLVEVVDDQNVRCYTFGDGSLHAESLQLQEPKAWWWTALDTGVMQYERPRPGRGEVPAPAVGPALMSTPRDGLAARLRGEGLTRYVLVVCDRSFEKETFGTEDVQVFEALAAHAGVAVERARSVSDLEALAEELEVARDAALAASEAKSMFLANMSHEIRTPLTTVLATAEILEDTPLDNLQLNLLEKMHRSGRTAEDAGGGNPRLLPNRGRTARTGLEAVRPPRHGGRRRRRLRATSDPTGTRFEWHLDPCVPRMVVGDPGRLFQVLTNLLDNALKFTHQGQVGLVVRPAKANDEGAAGRGRGVRSPRHRHRHTPRDQASIFEVFSQVDGSATRRYEGTGLGLAICKQLTELMGGTITVDSQLGVGSTFTVRLPLVAAQSAPPSGRDELPAVDHLSADVGRLRAPLGRPRPKT